MHTSMSYPNKFVGQMFGLQEAWSKRLRGKCGMSRIKRVSLMCLCNHYNIEQLLPIVIVQLSNLSLEIADAILQPALDFALSYCESKQLQYFAEQHQKNMAAQNVMQQQQQQQQTPGAPTTATAPPPPPLPPPPSNDGSISKAQMLRICRLLSFVLRDSWCVQLGMPAIILELKEDIWKQYNWIHNQIDFVLPITDNVMPTQQQTQQQQTQQQTGHHRVYTAEFYGNQQQQEQIQGQNRNGNENYGSFQTNYMDDDTRVPVKTNVSLSYNVREKRKRDDNDDYGIMQQNNNQPQIHSFDAGGQVLSCFVLFFCVCVCLFALWFVRCLINLSEIKK